jgi:hypothetical protein
MDALLGTEIDALVERRVQERVAAVATEATADLARLRGELEATRAEVRDLRRRTAETDRSPRFAAIYPAFEDRFRGSEAEVRERLAVYVPEVRDCVRSGTEGPRVLDVGPGRGEWLAMLADPPFPPSARPPAIFWHDQRIHRDPDPRATPKEDIDLSRMRVEGVDAAATAVFADALNTSLFGPQDYALLARVPPDDYGE